MKSILCLLTATIAILVHQGYSVSANVRERSKILQPRIPIDISSKVVFIQSRKSQVISDGTYASNNFGWLTVEGNKYRECGEDNCIGWQPSSQLKSIKKGVILLKNYYYCAYEQSEKGAARIKKLTCTKNGWMKKDL
jgi:hypothetical protein